MKSRIWPVLLIALLAALLAWVAVPAPDTGPPAAAPSRSEAASVRAASSAPRATDAVRGVPDPDAGVLSCALDSGLPFEGRNVLMMAFQGSERSGPQSAIQAWVDPEQLTFEPPFAHGLASVVVPGHTRAELEWSGSVCSWVTRPEGAYAIVSGRLNNADGGRIWVRGCGDRAVVVRGQDRFQLTTREPACTLRACRKRGLLENCGPDVPVALTLGEVHEVTLEVTGSEPAGIGIGLSLHDRGIGVNLVHPGSPAEAAGLQRGDVIVSVDGRPTVDMDIQEFIRWGTGPEGTQVSLEVMDNTGQFHDYVLTRAPIVAPGNP